MGLAVVVGSRRGAYKGRMALWLRWSLGGYLLYFGIDAQARRLCGVRVLKGDGYGGSARGLR